MQHTSGYPDTSRYRSLCRHQTPTVQTSDLLTRFRYQIQVGGKIVPTDAGASAPASNNLVDFDGVAMFLYESADDLTAMLSHPYYIDVVEPDEHVFIDKSAYGNGMVATYIGENIEVVDDERSVWVGDKKTRNKYQRLFKSYR